MPVSVQWEGQGRVQGRETSNIGSQWTGEDAREGGDVSGLAPALARPDCLCNDNRYGRETTQRYSSEHHLMRWDQRAITSHEAVPLNIPTGTQKTDQRTQRANQPKRQA